MSLIGYNTTLTVNGQLVNGVTGIPQLTVKPTGGKIVSYMDDVRYYPELTYIINSTRKKKLYESNSSVVRNRTAGVLKFNPHEMTDCSLNSGRLFYSGYPIFKLTYDDISELLPHITLKRCKIQELLTILKVNGKWRVYNSDSYRVEEAIKYPHSKNVKLKPPYMTGFNVTFIPQEITIP